MAVPQHILRAIEARGSVDQARWAAETDAAGEEQRRQRSQVVPVLEEAASWIEDALELLRRDSPSTPAVDPERVVLTGHNNRRRQDDTVKRAEGDPKTGDKAVDRVYQSLGDVWRYYAKAHDRSGIDDRGSRLIAVVHYGRRFANAFWNGRSMTFGEGDGEIFQLGAFVNAYDVIAHELTHGVIEEASGLKYVDQPGGLNESLADVFGISARHYLHDQTANEGSWVVGQGMFTSQINGDGLRNMLKPGTAYDDATLGVDPQYDHARHYQDGQDPHVSSGVPNRAFALAATNIGGKVWKTVTPVWYDALTSGEIRKGTSWSTFAELTVERGGSHASAIEDAWRQVGVL